MKKDKLKIADLLSKISFYSLLVLGILLTLFALLSGAEKMGGGFMGILKNSPNALPWIILLVFIIVGRKKELISGIAITLLGFVMLYFVVWEANRFILLPFILVLFITTLGILFLISAFIQKEEKTIKKT